MGFNPLNSVASFIAGLQMGQSFDLVDGKPDGLKEGDGTAAIQYSVSVGSGRGSAKVDLNGSQVPGVVEALKGFDPEADLSGLTPAECIGRTISRNSDGSTTFKLSLAKNSRSVKIPKDEWDNFLAYMAEVQGTIPQAVEHYRNVVAQLEKEANADK